MRLLNPDNRLLILARKGGRLPAVPTAIAVTFVILVVAGFAGQIPAHMVLLRPDGTPRFTNEIQYILQPIVLNVTVCAFFYLGLWAWLRLWSKRPFWTLGFERQHALRRTIRGIVIAGLMMAATARLSIIPGVSFAPGLVQTMGLVAFGIRFLSLLSYFVQGPGGRGAFPGLADAGYWRSLRYPDRRLRFLAPLQPGPRRQPRYYVVGIPESLLVWRLRLGLCLGRRRDLGNRRVARVLELDNGRLSGVCHGRLTPHWPSDLHNGYGPGHH